MTRAFQGTQIEVCNRGLCDPAEVTRIFSESDAMLAVRGRLYLRRGSALAGLACGLPIIGYAGAAQGTVIEEAGIALVPYGDAEALGAALRSVLTNPDLWQGNASEEPAHPATCILLESYRGLLRRIFRGKISLKIKLLLYSHDWFPLVGGVQTVTLSLATGLADWGRTHPGESIEVVFVTQTPAAGMDDLQFPFRVLRRPSRRELIRCIRSADILHLAGPTLLPLLFARLCGTPAVIEHHGYQSVCPNGLLLYAPDHTVCPGHFMAGRYRKCLQCNAKDLGWIGSLRNLVFTFPRRWLCARAAGNIAVSRHVAMRIALPRTRTIYHGILDAAASCRPDPSPGNGNPLRIGYVGRLVQEKGLSVLLDAAKQLANDRHPVSTDVHR